jgi:hypothetical protein
VALDAVLLKLPRNVYQRTGLRAAIARPIGGVRTAAPRSPGLRIRVVPAQVMLVLVLIAGALFAVDVGVQVVDDVLEPGFLGWEPIYRILDLNSEASLGTWFAIMMLFMCGVLLAIITVATLRAGDRFARHWAGLTLLVIGFSLDEQAKLHDLGSGFGGRMREMLGLGGVLYYGWVIVALVSVAIVGLIYREFVFALPAATRNACVVAAAFFVGGEMGMEMVGGWVMDRQGDTLLYRTMTSIEELFAMFGVLVAFGALLAYARSEIGGVSLQLTGGPATPDGTAAPRGRPAMPSLVGTIPLTVGGATNGQRHSAMPPRPAPETRQPGPEYPSGRWIGREVILEESRGVYRRREGAGERQHASARR